MIRRASVPTLAAAFTLIEVLIAVVVLGLGLLGLAAVFPVLVTEQRDATDKQIGASAAAVATAKLRAPNSEAESFLNDLRDQAAATGFQTGSADEVARSLSGTSLPAAVFSLLLLEDANWSPAGEWSVPVAGDPRYSIDDTTGTLVLDGAEAIPAATAGDLAYEIDVAERVIPAPYQRSGEPRYVWDFAARRVADNRGWIDSSADRGEVEIAVFVRRIDPAITFPTRLRGDDDEKLTLGRRLRLSDVIAFNDDELQPQELRLAVAHDPASFVPVPNAEAAGPAVYSAPKVVPVNTGFAAYGTGAGDTPRNVIPLAAGVTAQQRSVIVREGQRLVDQRDEGRAQVFEVVGITDNGNPIVSPPVSAAVESPGDLVNVLFVSQVPVAVEIVRVRP